jgi:hypothetical protein
MGLLADPIANGQGFLALFLMCHPVSENGFRLRTGYAPGSDRNVQHFAAQITACLEADLPIADNTHNQLEPRQLRN